MFSLYVFTFLFVGCSSTEDARLIVHVTTWNVNQRSPPDNLVPLMGLTRNPDVIAIGLQEVAVSPHAAVLNTIMTDKWSKAFDKLATESGYSKVQNVAMVGCVLNVYVQSRHHWNASVLDYARIRTGFKGFYGNKGGVALTMLLYGSTITFVAAHLHPNDGALEKRIEDFHIIEKRRGRSCAQEDYIFWFGDFNFRLQAAETLTANRIQHTVQKGDLSSLLKQDQLNIVRAKGKAFKGYDEMAISFKPTYRYSVGSESHDLQRRPAWTDRVLFKAAEGREIIPVEYNAIPNYTISDHKPVEAVFVISVAS